MRSRLRARGVLAVAALALVLAAVALLVAHRGLATDAPLAAGDGKGHYAQPRKVAEQSAERMKEAVREGGQRPLGAPQAAAATEDGAAAEADPSPAVGPLFYTAQDEPVHGCTASVVHSAAGDLVVTAAHCVYMDGFRTDLAFVPGYDRGAAPYGVWVPRSIDVAPEWTEDRDPDYDVAFLRMEPAEGAGSLERATGAARIRFDPPARGPARVVGYPNDGERPVACRGTTQAEGATQLRFDCEGLLNGTSGSPFLADDGATLVGVLGGKDEGGDEETSYSPYFGDTVARLYRRATDG
ncbi:serine protease [Streptomyces sp. NPDC049555]|uniref:trypsin-like serine peptidase n=1 Tax=Streptomyces sp. NPDC049555 TaxID=3154930 RepID=UPI00341D6630